MTKGIIVLNEIPGNCRNIRGDENGCPYGGMVCKISKEDVMEHVKNGTKPDSCPIKPIPERKMCTKSICISTEEYNQRKGWNACLEEIEGKM